MNSSICQLRDFLDHAHSSYHAIEGLKAQLEQAGYRPVSEGAQWKLAAGGKYYLTRGGSALIAFRIPQQTPTGFMLSAAHSDRPTFKVKENGELTGTYTRLATEPYGGMLMAPWLDRPLSIAGRVTVESADGIATRLLDVDQDLLLIPNVAIHMNRQANENQKWNPAVDMLPLVGSKAAAGKLWQRLEQEAGGKLLGHDLYLYVRQNASIWGIEQEYISAPALDDLLCAWCCTRGFIAAEESRAIPVLCVFDSEEVGSSTNQGAGSTMLARVLERIGAALEMDTDRLLYNSFILSADNAHGVHPNHPEYSDAANGPIPGSGVVLKFNANQRYTTDGVSAGVFRKICAGADVPVQTYCNRADLPGGSTLGAISLGRVSVMSADIGIAQLAMHSCYETASVQDVLYMEQAMTAYYGSSLEQNGDGTVQICQNNQK